MKTFFLLLLIAAGAFAQTPAVRWMINPYDDRVFIENNGQYAEEENNLKTKILFCFDQGGAHERFVSVSRHGAGELNNTCLEGFEPPTF